MENDTLGAGPVTDKKQRRPYMTEQVRVGIHFMLQDVIGTYSANDNEDVAAALDWIKRGGLDSNA